MTKEEEFKKELKELLIKYEADIVVNTSSNNLEISVEFNDFYSFTIVDRDISYESVKNNL